MRADQIIIAPVLTEKTNLMRESEQKKYTFKVNQRANKIQVMRAVEELFSVKALSCNITIVKSKPKFTRTRSGARAGATTAWKKAIVKVAKGDSISAIEGM
ncbi:MAG: 50S ribosomal protein L23 [Spirochaetales bacterium]|nr:50S ribosomal protein L23 [Spirochaetales bacterium]